MARRKTRKRGAPAAPPEEQFRFLWAVIIFGVALVVRLWAVWDLADLPLFRSPQADQLEYLKWARQIASSTGEWPNPPPHGPGYPHFLALLLLMFDDSISAARSVQGLLGSISCLMTFVIATRFFGRRAGFAAGLIQALYAPLLFVEVSLLGEGLLIFLILIGILIFRIERFSFRRAAAVGLVFGAAALVRPTAVVVLLLLALYAIWTRRGAGLTFGAVSVAVAVLALLPVTLKNRAVTGSLIPVQGYGGLNFYLGNYPGRSGLPEARFGGSWDAIKAEPLRNGLTAAGEQDRYYTRKTVQAIRRAPLEYLRLVASKALWLTQSDEPRDTHSIYFFHQFSPLLRLLIPFGLVVSFGVVGVFIALRSGTRAVPLLAMIVAIALTCVGGVVGLRYRLPLVPALISYAGLAVSSTIEMSRLKQWKNLAVLVVAVAALFISSNVRRDRSAQNFSEEWALTGLALNHERRSAEAEEAFRRATRLNPRSGFAWDGAGIVSLNSGNIEEAKQRFTRAAEVDPAYSRAAYHLGVVSAREGKHPTAVEYFHRALELRPDELEPRVALAQSLVELQRYGEAVREFEAIVAADPANHQAHLQLARIAGAAGQPAKGLRHARRAAELDPSSAEAWLLVAALAHDAGDLAVAVEALGNAERLGRANDPRFRLLRARISGKLSK